MIQALERGLLAGLAVALLVGGCRAAVEAPRPQGPVALATSRIGSGFAPIWVNKDLRPIGQLTAVGATMVGLIIENDRLYVVAIDPATGNVRWRQETAPSWLTPGVAIEVVPIGDDRVAYLRPEPGQFDAVELVVADAVTGRDLATSPRGLFSSMPYPCADGRDVCALSRPVAGARNHPYRLEIATGRYQTMGDALTTATRVLMSPSLFDLGDRPGNTLGWLHDGAFRWRVPVSAAFPPGFSSDYGWGWHEFADPHVIVGSVYGQPLAMTPKYVSDLAQNSATAAIAVDTGEVLWRDRGSSFLCHIGAEDYPVRCRRRGIATSSYSGPTAFEGLDVTIEGFELATGKTTWSIPMGAAPELADYRRSHVVAGPTKVMLTGPNGPIVLDYAAGGTTASPSGATFWCMTQIDYVSIYKFTAWDGQQRSDRPGGALAEICDARGQPAQELPGAEPTLGAGAHVAGYAVVAGRNGYIGFRVP